MGNLISDEYKALLTEKHDVRPWGGTGNSWVPVILPLVEPLRPAATILDYGCGRGTFKTAMPPERFVVLEYDPGVRGKQEVPVEAVDFVVCTDVLEHIEPEFVDNVLQHIRDLAKTGFFFVIVSSPSKSSLPDGRNTHIFQRPPAWWEKKLAQVFGMFEITYHERRQYQLVVSGARR